MDKIRNGICSFLRIQPATPNSIYINERLDRESNAIKNRIWYSGDSDELAEMYKQLDGDRTKFWAAVPTVGMEIRKLHTGLPAMIADRLTDIVMTDMNEIVVPPNLKDVWKDIADENSFDRLNRIIYNRDKLGEQFEIKLSQVLNELRNCNVEMEVFLWK